MTDIQGWKLPLRHVNIGSVKKKNLFHVSNANSIYVFALNFGYCKLPTLIKNTHLNLQLTRNTT